jgi:hypothetical protein
MSTQPSKNTQVSQAFIDQGRFDSLWVSPTDPNFILGGNVNVWKSTNGGNTFTQISAGYIMTAQPHVDIRFIVADPGYNGTTNKRVYLGTDGGMYLTNDITTAFFNPNNPNDSGDWVRKDQNYQTTQYYGAAGNGTTGLIYGGAQDNGTLRLLSSSQDAILSYGGDGGFVAVDPTDDNYCYGEYIYMQIHRSIDRGLSAQTIDDGIANVPANFVAPFILDPNNSNRMLAGGISLWATNNVKISGQPTWTQIRMDGSNNISAIAVATGNSNIIWVGQNDGKIYKTNLSTRQ